LRHLLANENENGHVSVEERQRLDEIILKAKVKNAWFTENYVKKSLQEYALILTESKLNDWLNAYSDQLRKVVKPKKVGVIMAGNIPLVGFHDMLSVLLSGHFLHARFSSDDNLLMQYIIDELVQIEPKFKERIKIVQQLKDIEAVIATGSNNTSRYFEAYFGKYPHIIRKNRNAVAVFTGDESKEELQAFGKDIFDYYGLGCRNVSKAFIPENFELDKLFEALQGYASVMEHTKYMNNFDMHSAILLMKKVPFLTNNFLIVKEDQAIASPIAMLHYERYSNIEEVQGQLEQEKENIQCVVSNSETIANPVALGASQEPGLSDYADGVDTLKFLQEL
ncbi:MAG: acyl-CoA reductase, partial [Bacteroidia bacterium]|nr:acyl-CoA reductase [Bacteroidia bacterium]